MSNQKVSSRLHLWSACLGNLFEHYDTALFSFLSPFLAPLIFPQQDPITALILTYAIIPLGKLAKPIGAIIFGWIGDLYGRAYALYLSLTGMAIISAIIAFIPGLSFTLGLAELAARNLMSGTARIMDAIMILFKLYFGAVLGIALGKLLWGEVAFIEPSDIPCHIPP